LSRFTDDNSETSTLEDGFGEGRRTSVDMDDDLEGMEEEVGLPDKEWLTIFREALSASSGFQQEKLRSPWSRNYRSFNNRHITGSKYETFKYRNRSKLFRPKTRMAVRKNLATTAGALFSTEDVVSVTPERGSDPMQSMTARMIHEILNYRLDRVNYRCGPNWFMTVQGARQDTQLAGRCISKQFWEYEKRIDTEYAERPLLDPNGLPVIGDDGMPITEMVPEEKVVILRDRPMVTLIPPEHAFIDPTGDWRDPIQEGGYFIAGFPMRKEDLEDMIEDSADRPRMGGGAWRSDIDLNKITQAAGANQRQADAIRRSRDDGTDRYQSRHADENGETIWLYECFYRLAGEDWHFWTLGEHIMLSDPRPVSDSYPEQKGERPYVTGVGEVESHKVYPASPVETWQPMQQEMNELTNLGLDALKLGISPITKIRKGRGVDLKQIQNRGPDAHVMVEELDDVTFDRAPAPPALIQGYMNNLNVDFDELAGVFSQGSVQTNRQMNETVGGMNLLAASSNALTEFDLRVFVETWVEPCLRQIVRCIQAYESDVNILGVAGEKAGLIVLPKMAGQQEGLDKKDPAAGQVTIDQVIDNMDKMPVTLRVNVGVGAMDSRQKLEKFMAGMKITGELGPLLEKEGYTLKGSAIIQEAWGLVGYKDADRFFEKKPEGEKKPPPPEVQREMMRQKAEQAKTQAQAQVTMQSKQLDAQKAVQVETIRQQGDQMARAQEARFRERELALDEREFMHKQRMDELEFQLEQQAMSQQRIEASLNDITQRMSQARLING
jgi:hypothetical protein